MQFKDFLHLSIRKIVPITTTVEASEAAWIYKSAVANDGNLRMVDGDMPTIMAGLACGEANIIGWDVL